jgi:hypothetical protein
MALRETRCRFYRNALNKAGQESRLLPGLALVESASATFDHRISLARRLLVLALVISSCAMHHRVSNIRAQCRRIATHAGLPVEDAGAEGDSRKQREEEQKQNNKNISSRRGSF